MLIYHGSNKIIEKPAFGLGKIHNDYGQGFYCTESIELAKEWACDRMRDGYANAYEIDIRDLNILNLNDGNYTVLHWLSVLVQNRTFNGNTDMEVMAKEFLIKNYHIDVGNYDVIKGYRADDSYFRFAEDFLNNTISIQKLEEAMYLGKLGEQIVLKSPRAFERIHYVKEKSAYADSSIYYTKKHHRDKNARARYRQIKADVLSGTFIRDIMKDAAR